MINQNLNNDGKEKDNEEEIILDIANFCAPYINEVCNKVASQFKKIIENEHILHLLHELRVREEEERGEFVRAIRYRIYNWGDISIDKFDIHNNALSHSKSYRDVLYDLLIKERRGV